MKRIKILFFIEELQSGGAEKVLCSFSKCNGSRKV